MLLALTKQESSSLFRNVAAIVTATHSHVFDIACAPPSFVFVLWGVRSYPAAEIICRGTLFERLSTSGLAFILARTLYDVSESSQNT